MVQAMTNRSMKETDPYLEKFERFEKQPTTPAWVFPLRKAGLARFAELGFPTLKDEDWRFTNVAPISNLPFKPVFQAASDGLTVEAINQFTLGNLPTHRLVFLNGHYAAELSSPITLPTGVKAGSLAAALITDSVLLEKHLAQYAQGADNAFTSLNTAFFEDGGFVYVPAGQVVETPIHLL